jgi:hypothetical protein
MSVDQKYQGKKGVWEIEYPISFADFSSRDPEKSLDKMPYAYLLHKP